MSMGMRFGPEERDFNFMWAGNRSLDQTELFSFRLHRLQRELLVTGSLTKRDQLLHDACGTFRVGADELTGVVLYPSAVTRFRSLSNSNSRSR